jgi:integrase
VPANRRVPSYRFHKASNQAVVVIDGKSHYLGEWNSPESRETYDRLIADWLRSGRRAQEPDASRPRPDCTVAEMILAFWRHAEVHYRHPDGTPTGELANLKAALRPLRKRYGDIRAAKFGPLALRDIQEEMIADDLARTSINARVNRIRRAFRWAVSVELIPGGIVQELEAVPGLQKGRTAAREKEPVRPVPIDVVEKTLPFLSRQVAGMVRLQLLTGMRPGEVCRVRMRDIKVEGDV